MWIRIAHRREHDSNNALLLNVRRCWSPLHSPSATHQPTLQDLEYGLMYQRSLSTYCTYPRRDRRSAGERDDQSSWTRDSCIDYARFIVAKQPYPNPVNWKIYGKTQQRLYQKKVWDMEDLTYPYTLQNVVVFWHSPLFDSRCWFQAFIRLPSKWDRVSLYLL